MEYAPYLGIYGLLGIIIFLQLQARAQAKHEQEMQRKERAAERVRLDLAVAHTKDLPAFLKAQAF